MLPAPKAVTSRVLSVDVLRGLTIALMILVNDPGDWSHVYGQLDHSAWNGFTLTDLVFPNFLFLVGASIIFSLESRIARGESKRTLALHMFRRALIIFLIKLFISAFPHFHLTHLRIFGVLTRIAACYLIAGLICLATRRARALGAIAAALLLGYWVLMRFVHVPGFGVPTHGFPILDPDRNLAAWLDRGFNAFTQHRLHTGSLYNHTRDPEGILSTIPAIATTLAGCVAGLWLRRSGGLPKPNTKPETIPRSITFLGLAFAGAACILAGRLWNYWFPINKNLWTSSYALFSAGLSLILLAACYWVIDVRHLNESRTGRAVLWPWLVFGSNAITAYVVSDLLVEIALWIKVPGGVLANPADPGKLISAWQWTYLHIFARHGSTNVTSVAFAIAFTAVCFLPNWLLWRRKIFLKI